LCKDLYLYSLQGDAVIEKLTQGVYAAVLTPRLTDGATDGPALRALLRFLLGHGVSRFAINGATGEFCLTTPEQLREVLAIVREEGGPDAKVLCGVGGAGLAQVVELTHVAEQAKVQGLLLPMPYFFPYSQDDLMTFCTEAANATRLPMLLYNLPQFTSGLAVETVLTLVRDVKNIVGIKDSSGSLEIVEALTQQIPEACRIIGNDSALAPALFAGSCDGVVSGVACVLPRLITALFHATPGGDAFSGYTAQLGEFIEQLNGFPTPWGLKWAAEAQEVLSASFAQPVSAARLAQAEAFMQWCREWIPMAQPETK
jgi:4-hydroxy-tetrahydrodipicolinate synthase